MSPEQAVPARRSGFAALLPRINGMPRRVSELQHSPTYQRTSKLFPVIAEHLSVWQLMSMSGLFSQAIRWAGTRIATTDFKRTCSLSHRSTEPGRAALYSGHVLLFENSACVLSSQL
jgi:hypothetical protein